MLCNTWTGAAGMSPLGPASFYSDVEMFLLQTLNKARVLGLQTAAGYQIQQQAAEPGILYPAPKAPPRPAGERSSPDKSSGRRAKTQNGFNLLSSSQSQIDATPSVQRIPVRKAEELCGLHGGDSLSVYSVLVVC